MGTNDEDEGLSFTGSSRNVLFKYYIPRVISRRIEPEAPIESMEQRRRSWPHREHAAAEVGATRAMARRAAGPQQAPYHLC